MSPIRIQTQSQSLTRDDCTIAWERLEYGNATPDAPVVLLHGFGMSRTGMRPLAEALLARNASGRVFLADARGHGDTRSPARDDAYGYPPMRDDCLALLERAAPDGAHLVGHSMGGQIALMAAIARPDRIRSLSLLGAGPCRAVTHEKERRSWERAAARFEAATPSEVAASLAAAAATHDEHLTPERVYAGARGDELARVVRGAFLGVESNDEECARLETPTLLIAGSNDAGWLEPTRKLAGILPDAELMILEDAGHLVHLERTGTCADAISRFLERVR